MIESQRLYETMQQSLYSEIERQHAPIDLVQLQQVVDAITEWHESPSMPEWLKAFSLINRVWSGAQQALYMTSNATDQINASVESVIKLLAQQGLEPRELNWKQLGQMFWLLALHREIFVNSKAEGLSWQTVSKYLSMLFRSADNSERQLMCWLLPLFNDQALFLDFARECARSNVVSVFDAIALNNRYPVDYFDSIGWNQLIIKAVFLNRPLAHISGLKQRNNTELFHSLFDYVKERWLANRLVPNDITLVMIDFMNHSHYKQLTNIAYQQGGSVYQQFSEWSLQFEWPQSLSDES